MNSYVNIHDVNPVSAGAVEAYNEDEVGEEQVAITELVAITDNE